MKFNIVVFDNLSSFMPIGGGLLENSGNDLEEKATGTLTISGYTVDAKLELEIIAPVSVMLERDAEALKQQMELYNE